MVRSLYVDWTEDGSSCHVEDNPTHFVVFSTSLINQVLVWWVDVGSFPVVGPSEIEMFLL